MRNGAIREGWPRIDHVDWLGDRGCSRLGTIRCQGARDDLLETLLIGDVDVIRGTDESDVSEQGANLWN
jgi:hypothetical protein